MKKKKKKIEECPTPGRKIRTTNEKRKKKKRKKRRRRRRRSKVQQRDKEKNKGIMIKNAEPVEGTKRGVNSSKAHSNPVQDSGASTLD